jgi:YesN/AraC family two-component response regulator
LAEAGKTSVLANDLRSISSLCMQAAACVDNKMGQQAYLMLGVFILNCLIGRGKQLKEGLKLLAETVPEGSESQVDYAKSYEACLLSLMKSGKQETEGTNLSPLIQKVQEYLHAHFKEGVSLSMVAEAFGVTPAYLSTLFHKEVGESYSKYLMRLRMEFAAVKLQSDPYIKMYDVAKQAGFVSSKHFISAFRKHFGKTPKEYKDLNQS